MRKMIYFLVLAMVGCASKSIEPANEKSMPAQNSNEQKPQAVINHPDENIESAVECTKGIDVRKIIVLKKSKGCEVRYSKFGANHTMATAKYELNYCNEVSDKIRAHLMEAGFGCK